jgi:hypothetical protein
MKKPTQRDNKNRSYLYPHDEVMNLLLEKGLMAGSKSWGDGGYSWPRLSGQLKEIIKKYVIS